MVELAYVGWLVDQKASVEFPPLLGQNILFCRYLTPSFNMCLFIQSMHSCQTFLMGMFPPPCFYTHEFATQSSRDLFNFSTKQNWSFFECQNTNFGASWCYKYAKTWKLQTTANRKNFDTTINWPWKTFQNMSKKYDLTNYTYHQIEFWNHL